MSRALRFFTRGDREDAVAYLIIARDKIDQIISLVREAAK